MTTDAERLIEARIAMYRQQAEQPKPRYQAIAAFQKMTGLQEALAILRGENPDEVLWWYPDE